MEGAFRMAILFDVPASYLAKRRLVVRKYLFLTLNGVCGFNVAHI